MKTLTPTRFQYNLSLLNGGSTTVRVEQKVNGVYQYLATQQTQTSSGTYELSFVPQWEDIRISVSGTSRYALQNLYLDRDQIDTLVATYALSRGYRYGSDSYRNQGQEKDDEVKGKGNSVNYTFRMHDPRLGRFFAVDPLASEYPHNSPFAFSENIVINAAELEGLEKVYVYNVWYDDKGIKQKKISHTYIDNTLKNHQRVYQYYDSKGNIYQKKIQDIADYKRNPTKGFYDNLIDASWNDGEYLDAAIWAFKKKNESLRDVNNGIKLMASTASVVFTGGTIAVAGKLTFFAAVSVISAVDDMTDLGNGETALSKLSGIEPKNLDKLKLGVAVASFTKGTQEIIKDFSANGKSWGTKEIVDFSALINDELNLMYSASQQNKPTDNNEK